MPWAESERSFAARLALLLVAITLFFFGCAVAEWRSETAHAAPTDSDCTEAAAADYDGEPYEAEDPDYEYWLSQQEGGSDAGEASVDEPDAVQDAEGSAAEPEPVVVRVEGAGGVSVPQRDIAETIRTVKDADPDAQIVCVVVI